MLERLAKNHDLWLRMTIGFGCDRHVAEDIVQSMYLRIHKYVKDEKRIMYDDEEVNRFFIYVTLKNMFIMYKKSKSKYTFFEVRESDAVDDEVVFDGAMESAFSRLMTKINKEIDSWHKYDRILSNKYLRTDYSLRDIARGTGISLTSIHHSMKQNKQILKDLFAEDYEDFKNGDYNLI